MQNLAEASDVERRVLERTQQLVSSNARLRYEVDHYRKLVARLESLAYYDQLTGLPNRGVFSKLLAQAIDTAHRRKTGLAVMFVDLDGFKYVNDTLGHAVGDALLSEMGARLSACLRQSDTVARLGGDEFVVLLPDLDFAGAASVVARCVLMAISQPFAALGADAHLTASVGISLFPRDGRDEMTLMKCAELAMYQAKSDGSNTICSFTQAGHQPAADVPISKTFDRTSGYRLWPHFMRLLGGWNRQQHA